MKKKKKKRKKDETTIKNIRNRFRLKNEVDENTVKDINLFRLKKENKTIKEIFGISLVWRRRLL